MMMERENELLEARTGKPGGDISEADNMTESDA
jgi:hypothetical protein